MMRRVALGALAATLAACAHPQVAITIDDLPVHPPYPPGQTANAVNAQMIAALSAAHVPVTTFLNGIGVEQHPETMAALEQWRAAGQIVGNHTWSHPHLSELTPVQFETELVKNEPILRRIGGTSDWRWFRYPFLDEGKDRAQRIAGRQVLAKHGYRVAAVMMSFSDWAFTGAWARCNAAHDSPAVAELERMYLASERENIAVARDTAHKLYGRDIPYVLLMHVSAMSAQMMPRVIQLYRQAGFRFVSVPQAESDPAYRGYTDLSLPPPASPGDLAEKRGVKLPVATDYSAKLAAICPGVKSAAPSP